MMRTIVIFGNYTRNLAIFRGPLISALSEAGWRVICVGPEKDDWSSNIINELGGEFVVCPMSRSSMNPLKDIAFLGRSAWLLFRIKPQVVLTFTHKPNTIVGAVLSLFRRSRQIMLIEGMGYAFIDVHGLRKRIANLFLIGAYKFVSKHCAAQIFINSEDRALFSDAGMGASEEKIFQIDGIGVDLNKFRATLLPSQDVPSCLMVARLLKTKGVLEYCEAARIVRGRMVDVRFLLVGTFDPSSDGVPLEQLKPYIDRGDIELIGQSNDLAQFYRDCTVYVLPSYREGVPVTILEAMASARPVVATDVPGCRTTVHHGVTGLLVPPRDSLAVAEAILALLRGRAAAEGMARRGRELAELRFDVRVATQRQLKIIHSCISDR